jgi:4-hydroxybutyryl-CoA dehydratase/vinylacetyl-CoA-Delta-isomerase
MLDGERYRASLDDGRAIYFEGERVASLAKHPLLGRAVDTVAAGYDHWYSPGQDARNPLLGVTASGADLQAVLPLFDEADALLNLTYQTIMCLLTASSRIGGGARYAERMADHVRYLQTEDLRSALCITDAKGNRSLPPLRQEDPDAYTRVARRRRGRTTPATTRSAATACCPRAS